MNWNHNVMGNLLLLLFQLIETVYPPCDSAKVLGLPGTVSATTSLQYCIIHSRTLPEDNLFPAASQVC